MFLIILIFSGVLAPSSAEGLPFELLYSGQLLDTGGNPMTSLGTAPSGHVPALRFTFWTAQTGGTQVDVTLLGSSGGAEMTVPGTMPAVCASPFTPSCQSVAVNTNGVFQISVFLSPADFHTLFPDTPAMNWIQTERVYVKVSDGTVTSAPSPVPTRQRFTVSPYALKVPVDGVSVTYNASGQLTTGAGGVLQTVFSPFSVTQIATSSTSFTAAGPTLSITPKSASSTLLVECTFGATSGLIRECNTHAVYGLFETTSGNVQLGEDFDLYSILTNYGAGAAAPATLRATVPNTATTTRKFNLFYKREGACGGTVYVRNRLCTIAEYPN